jgi:hypothetical protein
MPNRWESSNRAIYPQDEPKPISSLVWVLYREWLLNVWLDDTCDTCTLRTKSRPSCSSNPPAWWWEFVSVAAPLQNEVNWMWGPMLIRATLCAELSHGVLASFQCATEILTFYSGMKSTNFLNSANFPDGAYSTVLYICTPLWRQQANVILFSFGSFVLCVRHRKQHPLSIERNSNLDKVIAIASRKRSSW